MTNSLFYDFANFNWYLDSKRKSQASWGQPASVWKHPWHSEVAEDHVFRPEYLSNMSCLPLLTFVSQATVKEMVCCASLDLQGCAGCRKKMCFSWVLILGCTVSATPTGSMEVSTGRRRGQGAASLLLVWHKATLFISVLTRGRKVNTGQDRDNNRRSISLLVFLRCSSPWIVLLGYEERRIVHWKLPCRR
jgi:hypothetical protein